MHLNCTYLYEIIFTTSTVITINTGGDVQIYAHRFAIAYAFTCFTLHKWSQSINDAERHVCLHSDLF